jgi:hypothetical protein
MGARDRRPGPARRGRAEPKFLSKETFGEIMQRAVPLDPIGDQRISELLSQLRDERDRRASQKSARPEPDRRAH